MTTKTGKTEGRSASHLASRSQVLTFDLGAERFAVPILEVREIIGMTEITPVPGLPTHVRGVLNLRGRIVPVVDLREHLGMGVAPRCETTCIVVVERAADSAEPELDASARVGCIVDTVHDVVEIEETELTPAPELGRVASDAVRALAQFENDLLILLDVRSVVRSVVGESGTTGAVDQVGSSANGGDC